MTATVLLPLLCILSTSPPPTATSTKTMHVVKQMPDEIQVSNIIHGFYDKSSHLSLRANACALRRVAMRVCQPFSWLGKHADAIAFHVPMERRTARNLGFSGKSSSTNRPVVNLDRLSAKPSASSTTLAFHSYYYHYDHYYYCYYYYYYYCSSYYLYLGILGVRVRGLV